MKTDCKKHKIIGNHFITKLPSYSLYSIILRFTIVSIVGVLAMQFIVFLIGTPEVINDRPGIKDYILIILTFNLLAESNIIVDIVFERYMPIPKKIKLRLAIQSLVGLLLIVAIYHLIQLLVPEYKEVGRMAFSPAVAMGLIFVNTFSVGLVLLRFMDKWVYAQKRIDEMKQEKLKMDYTMLQDQINPHFLFNNLSALKSLIMFDKDTAISFTQNFTDVYRYVLKSKDSMLVTLKDELQFIDKYVSLHKERLGEGLDVQYMIDKEYSEKDIAPLTLQLLVENAIKHNVVSKEDPLLIEIVTEDNYVIIKNKINLKESSYSTKTGLINLLKRYELLDNKKILVENDDYNFVVKVPLL